MHERHQSKQEDISSWAYKSAEAAILFTSLLSVCRATLNMLKSLLYVLADGTDSSFTVTLSTVNPLNWRKDESIKKIFFFKNAPVGRKLTVFPTAQVISLHLGKRKEERGNAGFSSSSSYNYVIRAECLWEHLSAMDKPEHAWHHDPHCTISCSACAALNNYNTLI